MFWFVAVRNIFENHYMPLNTSTSCSHFVLWSIGSGFIDGNSNPMKQISKVDVQTLHDNAIDKFSYSTAFTRNSKRNITLYHGLGKHMHVSLWKAYHNIVITSRPGSKNVTRMALVDDYTFTFKMASVYFSQNTNACCEKNAGLMSKAFPSSTQRVRKCPFQLNFFLPSCSCIIKVNDDRS